MYRRFVELCRTDARYYRLYNGDNGRTQAESVTKPQPVPKNHKGECCYLGPIISRMNVLNRPCQCPKKWLRKCEIHGECTLNEADRDGVAVCVQCDDFEE